MDRFDLDSLHAMIGKRVSFRGGSGVVAEVLEDEPALVIRIEALAIQPDSLGYARRKTQETVLVRLFDTEGSYTSDFLEILKLREQSCLS